ncbi:MAG: hypothetical protein U0W40_18545 [Acidimicrobiia bacterium]
MGAETFQKRERERKRKEKAELRRERRDNKAEPGEDGADAVDTDELMEQFRILSEKHAAGEIDSETYEAERTTIFELLGMM